VDIFLTNSLSRKKEKFSPINPPKVGMYTCGPTVYQYVHIGNFRTYTTSDILFRLLKYNAYQVLHVMNITDVGHLTGDNLGDADIGEDRIEASAKKQGKSAYDIARFYTEEFLKDMALLNIEKPGKMPYATEHIKAQIELIESIEKKGFTYKTSDGIYFDTQKYEGDTGKEYGELSTLDEIKVGTRVEENPEKKNPRDFALWKFSKTPGERQMEWDSPWGLGFPGWHIECSAMSMQYLGESFDIHVGGEDLRSTHHPNEIAQSEAATGKPFVKYWVHAAFLQVDGKRMGRSLGNTYKVSDVIDKGFDPLSLRYLYLSAHYRDPLNFTWDSLKAADVALKKLRDVVVPLAEEKGRTTLSAEKAAKLDKFREDFLMAVSDDLNTPRALATVWEMLKSNIPSPDKYELAVTFDEILGLELIKKESVEVPESVAKLVEEREKLRSKRKFSESDEIRKRIETQGFWVEDTSAGPRVRPKR
jgi:cysteinyl-tRNA synthetase